MASRKFRSAVLIGVVVGVVALGGCVGNDTGTNTTTAPGTATTDATDGKTTDSPDGETTDVPQQETTVSPEVDSATNDATTDVAEAFEARMSDLDSYSATMSMRTAFDGNETSSTTKIWARLTTDEVRREVVSSSYNEGSVTISNESKIVTYNPDANEITRINRSNIDGGQTDSTGMTMIDSVANSMTIEELGTERLDGERAHRVRLEPDSGAASGDMNVTAWLDAETYFPVRVETTSGSGKTNFSSVVEYDDVELNPTIPDERFTLDAPADANTSDVSLHDSRTYVSIGALRDDAAMSVPEPDVPEGFSLEQARLTDGESRSVSLQYANESAHISVTKTNDSVYNGSSDDEIESVRIGNRTGQYDEFGATGIVVWSCDGDRYSVSGGVSRAQLIDVAASIECV